MCAGSAKGLAEMGLGFACSDSQVRLVQIVLLLVLSSDGDMMCKYTMLHNLHVAFFTAFNNGTVSAGWFSAWLSAVI